MMADIKNGNGGSYEGEEVKSFKDDDMTSMRAEIETELKGVNSFIGKFKEDAALYKAE